MSEAFLSSRSSVYLPPRPLKAAASEDIKSDVLAEMQSTRDEAQEYAESFELSQAEASLFALFSAIKTLPVGLGFKGTPFVLRREEIDKAMDQESGLSGFFKTIDLEKALKDDFLDAARGSVDNRSGWKIFDVSQPRGESFEEARMSHEDVTKALEKGTVIFNAAGAHIPKLAGPSLACTDATALPCALNLYVTDMGKRTSAPPHTDKQDVVVVQTEGSKHWKVYSPPNPADNPLQDPFSRGKGDDSLPLHRIESDLGCQLVLETTLQEGDVLFIPASFPHTTSTDVEARNKVTSIHMTLGIDHLIWNLDFQSAREFCLRRISRTDLSLSKDDNLFHGAVNELPMTIYRDLAAPLPLGLLVEGMGSAVEESVSMLQDICTRITKDNPIDAVMSKQMIERLCIQGTELLDIHRDMYVEALNEGRTRLAEDAMTSHLSDDDARVMSPERVARLSLFRVKKYFDRIEQSKRKLLDWVNEVESEGDHEKQLPTNWQFTLPVKVGQQIEADLGGAFFSATVTAVNGESYDVRFFDGDEEFGLERSHIKLLQAPPQVQDQSNLTSKQRKRLKKKLGKSKSHQVAGT